MILSPAAAAATARQTRDCRGWLWEAGFRQTRVEHLLGPDSMVVGVK
jgi:hypothetical protein